MTEASAIYRGQVVHERLRPRRHRLRYSVFSLLVDLDELPSLDRRLSLFGYNRGAPISFHDRDHGPADGRPLRPWVEERLREAGIMREIGPIRLLCYPRMLGYVFNPLSVYFCHEREGRLAAIVYQVCNTFGERRAYVLPVAHDAGPVIRQSCAKTLYVSPFIGMECTYHFRILPPTGTVSVTIRQEDREGLLLAAAFRGARRPLTGRALAGCLLVFPLMTLKVIAAIHLEALRLWLKGLPVFPHVPAGRDGARP